MTLAAPGCQAPYDSLSGDYLYRRTPRRDAALPGDPGLLVGLSPTVLMLFVLQPITAARVRVEPENWSAQIAESSLARSRS